VPGAKIGLPNPEEYGSSSAPKVITVTVAAKSGNHPYESAGGASANAYYLDGLESPALRISGVDSSYPYYYRFDQSDSSNSSHPLRFYLEADKTTAYTTNVTTNGTAGSSGAYTQIAVDENTPNILYYQCSSHAYMGNHVVNIGNTVNINSITGQIIPGKIEGTNFADSLLVGHSTSGTLSSAEDNTGVGIAALDALTSGDQNTAIGNEAATALTSSGKNTAVGMSALASVTTSAGFNSAFGRSALQLVTGAYNTGIGAGAGENITSGDGNVIIGKVLADSATGDRQLKIAGYDGSTTTTWISGDNSGNITIPGTVTANGETLSAGVSAGFAVAMAIAL